MFAWKFRFALARLALGASLSVFPLQLSAQGTGWIDVHFHILAEDESSGEKLAAEALEIMGREGIRSLVILPPPQSRAGILDGGDLVNLLRKHGERFAVLGGGGTLNPMLHNLGNSNPSQREQNQFREMAQRIARSGVKGFGEIALTHLSLNASHPYESVPADHPFLRMLADIAAEHDIVIDAHFDPVVTRTRVPEALKSFKNPEFLEPNIEAFERLLAHNRNAKFVWAHAGGSDFVGHFTPALVGDLLARHSNLFASLRPLGPTPGVMINPARGINKEWVSLLQQYPERFVFGSDSFLISSTGKAGVAGGVFAQRSPQQRMGIRKVLLSLPPEVAKKVGYENAERLYRMK